ncbi:MAG: ATP-dependent helicase [Candidatus Omnitrophica bacterium]|nr:ATP-dependent helicase [Candidatus Omnitrophota bacterium]MCM8802399.1 ATP-dependent helicase [Candidatus Omnitrophota bacterium]
MENKIPFEAVIKEASAGTGKTYSIIEKIFDLKNNYDSYEILKKILAITFSENAAIELKKRLIDEILNKEYEKFPDTEKIKIQNILLRINFSTIHSFARKILKRFAFMLQIDPFFKIIEEKESDILFSESLSKIFLNTEKTKIFYEILKNIKLNQFTKIIFGMRKLHPYVFLGSSLLSSSLTELMSNFYKNVDDEYFLLKRELGYLDFNDLEKLTYSILNENSDSLLILEDFDEKINFIFIDEFQDTNLLQWKIIQKLIEEWLSGWGAKAEKGEKYGIYIVGDKKQSIYKFRGAESSLFDEAKKVLHDYCRVEKLKINYRSSEKIIEFVNDVFKNDNEWKGEELVPNNMMKGSPSKIEIAFFKEKENEYQWVCNKICSLLKNENILVFDKTNKKYKKIELRDIMILVRKRNKSFKLLEEELKNHNIPYVVIGGIGFYQESEIKFLLSLVYALIDPTDYYALWNLQNSIFEIKDKFYKWREKMNEYEISFLIEKVLDEINFWNSLSTQQIANVEKFLSILQNQSHFPHYQILKNLKELSKNPLEPKADVFSVHQNAVKIMTIHRAKGLEAPVVFLINVEDLRCDTKNDIFFYKKVEDKYVYTYKDESNEQFKKEFINQMLEEENRILYVALTRAMQFLYITGNIEKEAPILNKIKEISISYPPEKEEKIGPLNLKEVKKERETEIPFTFKPFISFTKEKREKGISYSETIIGSIIHKIIQEISNDFLEYRDEKIKNRIRFYLQKEGEKEKIDEYEKRIFEIFENLQKNKEIVEIIKERVSEYVKSEYPFICEINGKIYEGVIDKIFIMEDKIKIYEFKVYLSPYKDYRNQLEIYKTAVRKIFKINNIECFVIDLKGAKMIKFNF